MIEPAVEVASLSHPGTERADNEDHCATLLDGETRALAAVADGVSGFEGGEVASQRAVEAFLRCYGEQPALPVSKRLARAIQRANIEVHDLALVVPELRGMATTMTAVAVDGAMLHAVHVGDCRLYLVRRGELRQLSKDHTVVGERVRMGVMSESRARQHPDRSVLTRSLGRELIVAVDRISTELEQGDVVVVCSDGLYNVLDEGEIRGRVVEQPAPEACRTLIEAANARGTADNLTVAVLRLLKLAAPPARAPGLGARLLGALRFGR
jgi:protein phosphatase